MGDVVMTMSVIVVANAILLPLAAYGCMRLGLLPGVDWYWPFQGHRDGALDSGASAPGRATDAGEGLSRELAAQVTAAIAPPVGQALQSLVERMGSLHEAALNRMVGHYLDRLEAGTMTKAEAAAGRFGQRLDNAGQAAREVADRLEMIARHLDDMDRRQHRLDHTLAIAVRGLADLIAEFNQTAGELTARLTEREEVDQR